MWRKLAWPLGIVGLLILLLFSGALIKLGPRFVFGILRYDTRRIGTSGAALAARSLEKVGSQSWG